MNKKLEEILTGEYQFNISKDYDWFIENMKEIITTLHETGFMTITGELNKNPDLDKYDSDSVNRLLKVIDIEDYYLTLSVEELEDLGEKLIQESHVKMDNYKLPIKELNCLEMVINILNYHKRIKRLERD